MLLLCCLLTSAACAAQQPAIIDDFEADLSAWTPTMRYGDTENCRLLAGEGLGGGQALRIDYDFRASGTNHVIYWRPVSLDLSFADGLSVKIRGSGDPVRIFLFLYDSQGRFRNYGPDGTNPDFTTAHPDWYEARVLFDRDRSCQGGDADLADIRQIGFMLNGGPARGSAFFDDLAVIPATESLRVWPVKITPNRDGLNDRLAVTVTAQRDEIVAIEVVSGGQVVRTLRPPAPADHRRSEVSWDGRSDAGRRLPPGEYVIRARFQRPGDAEVTKEQTVMLDDRPPWPPIKYAAPRFFPIGVWFEGAPGAAGYPSDAEGAARYYDRCFGDLAAHGLNAVAVPNCPEALWETLLRCAERHGVKVVLEIGPLVGLVSSAGPLDEQQIDDAVTAVVKRLARFGSLLRYQIRDEPPPELIPNWVAVQRVLAARDPRHPAFSCCCHVESVRMLREATTLSEAVFDIYPFLEGRPAGDTGWFFPALKAFCEAAGDLPKWAVLQSFAKPGTWRYPTPEELRCTVYSSLAAGAKGIFFFIYQTMPNHPEKLEGLIDPQGRPLAMYEAVSRLAAELRKLAPTLLRLQPIGPTRWPGEKNLPVILSHFRDDKGRNYLIIANANPAAPVKVPLQPILAENHISLTDCLTGEEFVLQPGTSNLPLGPGAGRVMLMQ